MSTSAAALAEALEKAVGASDDEVEVKHWFDTGYPPLNQIISGDANKGMPHGRIIEIYGPPSSGKTLLSTLIMRACQQMGGFAGFSDHEYTWMMPFAKRLGLSDESGRWHYKRPETWEASNTLAMRAAEVIRKSGAIPDSAPIVWVFDSVHAMIPRSKLYDAKTGKRKELDELSMNDQTALARATSGTLPVINQVTTQCGVTAVYLNQIRTKPGVCLRYDAPVTLADGQQVKIGQLVHAQEPVEVLTVNDETGEVSAAAIVQFHRNRHDGKWVQIVTAGGKNGKRSAFFTPEHEILTPAGWRRADEIRIGDKVKTVDCRYYTDDQHRLLFGALLGDGQIRFGDGKSTVSEKGRLRMVHGKKQRDYLAWKCRLLGIAEPMETDLHCYADTASSHEFLDLRVVRKFKALIEVPQKAIEAIDPFVAAIWFMDDGSYAAQHGGRKYGEGRYSIAAKKLSQENLDKIASHFNHIGMGQPIAKAGKGLFWSGENAARFGAAVAPYVPSCMGYKLNRKLTPNGDGLRLDTMSPQRVVYQNTVLSVTHKQGSKSFERYKYDIGVPGTHTFVAGGGMVVHNCYGDPTTTPGGTSFEYYASVRLALGKKKIMAESGGEKEFVGQLVGITTKKNKLTRPFQEVDLRLTFEEDGMAHFDFTGGMVEHLAGAGKIEMPSKGWYLWKGKKFTMKQLAAHIDVAGEQGELRAMFV